MIDFGYLILTMLGFAITAKLLFACVDLYIKKQNIDLAWRMVWMLFWCSLVLMHGAFTVQHDIEIVPKIGILVGLLPIIQFIIRK